MQHARRRGVGTLTLSDDGAFSYTPAAGFLGTDSFSYQAFDSVTVSTVTSVSISVVEANLSPEISGGLFFIARAGSPFSFTPTANDPNNDPLTFTGFGTPSWATVDPTSGTLSGTPQASDIGVYTNIWINVFDGELSSWLGPLEINVAATTATTITLGWLPPTTNEDGSPLLDLAGYNIYYWDGNAQPDEGSQVITDVPEPGLSSYVLDLPSAGFWKIAITAYNSVLRESSLSKTIPVIAE